MNDQQDDQSLQMDIGRANGGLTFVRVVHLPTGKERKQVGMNGESPGVVGKRLAQELMKEIDPSFRSDVDSRSNEAMTPQQLYHDVVSRGGDCIAAIRAVRETFGLDTAQAKEVMLQAESVALSNADHQERLAKVLENLSREANESPQPRIESQS